MPLIVGFTGAWIASEGARELCADIQAAATRAGLSRKDMAYHMDLSESQLSDQLALRHPLNAYRLADLPKAFWRQFVVVRAERVAVQVIEDSRLQELMRALDRWQVSMLKSELRRKDERQVG